MLNECFFVVMKWLSLPSVKIALPHRAHPLSGESTCMAHIIKRITATRFDSSQCRDVSICIFVWVNVFLKKSAW